MNDEIQVLDQILLPIIKASVEKKDSVIRHVGLSPMVLEDAKLEEFVNSDPTILYYFQNFCTSKTVNMGARNSITPESFKVEYFETENSERLIPAGLFLLSQNDGSLTCFSIEDRKVYNLYVCWEDEDWRKSYSYKWDSLREYIEQIASEVD